MFAGITVLRSAKRVFSQYLRQMVKTGKSEQYVISQQIDPRPFLKWPFCQKAAKMHFGHWFRSIPCCGKHRI
jgi:hypothetical protein